MGEANRRKLLDPTFGTPKPKPKPQADLPLVAYTSYWEWCKQEGKVAESPEDFYETCWQCGWEAVLALKPGE